MEKIKAHLNEKWTKPIICPMCGSNDLDIQKDIVELNEFDNGDFVEGTQYSKYGVIPIICKNCGNILLVSSVFQK